AEGPEGRRKLLSTHVRKRQTGGKRRVAQAPYPEEMNRQLTGVLADYHFAPTERAAGAHRRDNKPPERVFITGKNGKDPRNTTVRPGFNQPELEAVRAAGVVAVADVRGRSTRRPAG
ncbi:UDP-N-acetylglucosamine 2-epimerase, partial [Hydrogenibacillus schlegelii]|uniref:UDP-N-acetylglucosamine 2-epimerase n=1 Tax=Hydrogenibacillus schlegelii TaxID=1484 RepID=UPI0034A0795D